MNYTIEQSGGFIITGIKQRTDNTVAAQVIPGLWERFFKEDTVERIRGSVPDGCVYAVYINYESDEHGEYDFFLGVRTRSKNENDDFMCTDIPKGSYAVFTAKSNAQVAAVWQQIWKTDLKRTYAGDFECYHQKTGQISIYVGIQNN